MKFANILETATRVLSGVKVGGAKRDPKLAALDRGVLEVALLLAALDGTILPEEYAAFETLAKTMRGYSPKNTAECLDKALWKAGYLMATAQVGVYCEKRRVDAFISLASAALPNGFENGAPADVRRAFALWVAMAASDGTFSDVERRAVEALRDHFAQVRYDKAKEMEDCWAAMSPTFRQAYGGKTRAKMVPLLEADYLDRALEVVNEMAKPSRRAKAEEALAALVG